MTDGKVQRMTPEQLSRFLSKVDQYEDSEKCWIWTKSNNGVYGVFKLSSYNQLYSHRVSYEHYHGPIDEGNFVDHDHKCSTKLCVNPNHLRQVSPKQNCENWTVENIYNHKNNHTSGIRGVSWHKQHKKWRVNVTHNKVTYFAGYYTDLDEAIKASISLRNQLFTHNDADRP